MSSRVIRRAWSRQPARPALNPAHPLAERVALWLPMCGPEWRRDVVSGERVTLTGAMQPQPGRFGEAPLFGAGLYVDFVAPARITSHTQPMTFVINTEGRSTSAYSALVHWKAPGASQAFLIYRAAADSAYQFAVGPGGSSSVYTAVSGLQGNDTHQRYVVVCPNGLAATGTSAYFVACNGVLLAAGSVTTFGSSTSAVSRIGALGSGSDPFEGFLDLMILDGALAVEEAIQLSRQDDWSLAQPSRRRRLAPVSGTVVAAGPGVAVAAGPGALLQRSLLAGPAVALAAGVAAQVSLSIPTGPGDAMAQGVTALLSRSIYAGPGAASAIGVSATITDSSGVTIAASPGDAVATGTMAHVDKSLSAAPGVAAATGVQAQIISVAPTVGRPAQDVANSGWLPSSGSDLYPMLDEETPDATDYIRATATGAVCELALNATQYPGGAAQILRFRASSSTGNSLIVQLKNTGGAVVRSHTQALTATDSEYSLTLTPAEIALITSGALSVVLESA